MKRYCNLVSCSSRLQVAQLRLAEFCNSEALLGIFDWFNHPEISKELAKTLPRILLEERTVKETASEYMKYAILSAHR